jgi:hypothetical protein
MVIEEHEERSSLVLSFAVVVVMVKEGEPTLSFVQNI